MTNIPMGPRPPEPPLTWIHELWGETLASKIAHAKHVGASDMWNAMFKWIDGGRVGDLPYPSPFPALERHCSWWDCLLGRDQALNIKAMANWEGEIEEFHRWVKYIVPKGV